MKILQSNWVCALLGAVLYLGTTVAAWKTPPIEHHTEALAESVSNMADASWNFHNPEVDEMVADLRKRGALLDAREKQLNDLATSLELERREIVTVTQAVARLQSDFDANLVRVAQEETANLKKLGKIYAAMAPDGAAAILRELKDDDIVKIFAFMKDSETAPILESLAKQGTSDAKRAAQISQRMRVCLSRAPNDKPKS